jgi:cysteinyl-tRNA synthetase
MNVILEIRKNAREKKDFATSDLIRDRLGDAGIQIKDSKEGVSYSVN